jgi:hypothetical protein
LLRVMLTGFCVLQDTKPGYCFASTHTSRSLPDHWNQVSQAVDRPTLLFQCLLQVQPFLQKRKGLINELFTLDRITHKRKEKSVPRGILVLLDSEKIPKQS